MTDIVERLRKVPSIGGYFKDELSQEAADKIEFLMKTHDDMADEIERLREALQSIANNTCCDKCQEAALVALAALKEKE